MSNMSDFYKTCQPGDLAITFRRPGISVRKGIFKVLRVDLRTDLRQSTITLVRIARSTGKPIKSHKEWNCYADRVYPAHEYLYKQVSNLENTIKNLKKILADNPEREAKTTP